jgi:signal transduction histidine kinase
MATATEWSTRALDALPDPARHLIVASWQRCAARGLRPDATPEFRSVPSADLERRLRDNADVLSVASKHLRWLSRWLARFPHVAYLVDAEGVVLFATGDEEIARSAALQPGFVWSEALMGTNGAGTALVNDRPVAVLGCEHFVEAWRAASCLASPVHHPDGRIAGAIDLTTSVEQGDPELLGLVAHTALTIDQELRSRELDAEHAARLEADARRADREQLLAGVAHDLRGPNAVVSMIADALPNAEIESARAMLRRASTLTEGLVRELLDFSRMSEGRFGVAVEKGDLAALVREVAGMLEPVAAANGIALQVSHLDGAHFANVTFDGRQLNRALTNVLQNALKFTPAGGRVEIRLEATAADVRVAITDTGPGIPSSDLERIFEPYWSGHMRSDSAGLGLAIANGIVKAHGGKISAENAAGGGARFVIALPRT